MKAPEPRTGWSGQFGPGEPAKHYTYGQCEAGKGPTVELVRKFQTPQYRIERPKERRDLLGFEQKRPTIRQEALNMAHTINRAMSSLVNIPRYDSETHLRLPVTVVNAAERMADLFQWKHHGYRLPKTVSGMIEDRPTTTPKNAGEVVIPVTRATSNISHEVGRLGRAERYLKHEWDPTVQAVVVNEKKGTRLVKSVKKPQVPASTTPILTSAR